MQFELTDNNLTKISADVLIVLAVQSENKKGDKFIPLSDFKDIDKNLKGSLINSAKLYKFGAKRGEMHNFFSDKNNLSKWIIVLGLGKKSEFAPDDLRRAFGKLSVSLKGKVDSAALSIPSKELKIDEALAMQLISEGIFLGSYEFNKYKSENEKEKDFSIVVISTSDISKKLKNALEKAKIYSDATILARDLVNEQSALATPTYLANLAKSIARKDKKHIKCKIFDKEEIKKMGMGAFLGVSRAADTPPKFIFLEYIPDKKNKKEKLALVGKGITFDSGGMNIKPGDSMIDMKIDMAGAAVVLSVFSVISEINPEYPVIGLIAATPNLISGSSIVPGDVVRAMNGKTIEILNTDAEGRVTMADSLSFAVKEGATKIIDFATLTGAAMVALGTDITALFSNDKEFAYDLKRAAGLAGEKVWELPLEKEYKELNKSEVADVANIPSTRYGGTISAALFLKEFVDGKSWIHLDIAGPTYLTKATDIGPKGATGHGVRTTLNYLTLK